MKKMRVAHWKKIYQYSSSIISAFPTHHQKLHDARKPLFWILNSFVNPKEVSPQRIIDAGRILTNRNLNAEVAWIEAVKKIGGMKNLIQLPIGKNFAHTDHQNERVKQFVETPDEIQNPGIAVDRYVAEFCEKFMNLFLLVHEDNLIFRLRIPLCFVSILHSVFVRFNEDSFELIRKFEQASQEVVETSIRWEDYLAHLEQEWIEDRKQPETPPPTEEDPFEIFEWKGGNILEQVKIDFDNFNEEEGCLEESSNFDL
jgi:hypothetical protein